MPSFILTYITKIFKAETQYDFNIQSKQEKILSAFNVYKIDKSERLKFLFQLPTSSDLLT